MTCQPLTPDQVQVAPAVSDAGFATSIYGHPVAPPALVQPALVQPTLVQPTVSDAGFATSIGSARTAAQPAAAASSINLKANSITYYTGGSRKGGATVGVTITRNITTDLTYTARLYWSEKSALTGKWQQAAEGTITVKKPNSGSGNVFFDKSIFSARPAYAKYLIVKLDPNNAISETNEGDNSQWCKL